MVDKDVKTSLEKSNEKFRDAALGINKMVDESITTLTEAVFVSKLLPIMREWVVNKNGENVHLWVIAAGGPERPIKVSLGGDDYFLVPPPYNHPSSLSARHQRENNQIHAIAELMTRRQADGEAREVMNLGDKMVDLLSTEYDKASFVRYVIMLAKIWERYNYPVEEVLADVKVDLSLYDKEGYYVDNGPQIKDSGEDDYEEDELQY